MLKKQRVLLNIWESSMLFLKKFCLSMFLVLLPLSISNAQKNDMVSKPIKDTLDVFRRKVPLSFEHCWESFEGYARTTEMIWRDCNLDGYVDGVFMNGDSTKQSNFIYLLKLRGQKKEASWKSERFEKTVGGAIGDIDDDGYPDLVECNTGELWIFRDYEYAYTRAAVYYSNSGLLEKKPSWISSRIDYSTSCDLGDFDNDGDLDLGVATGVDKTSPIRGDTLAPAYKDIVFKNENGSLSDTPTWLSLDTTTANDIVWGDLDNDGDLDLVCAVRLHGGVIYKNNAGIIDSVGTYSSFQKGNGKKIVLGDINNDKYLDIVIGYYNNDGLKGYTQLYLNNGFGEFYTDSKFTSYMRKGVKGLALYDYDWDNDLDLAVCQMKDSTLVFENVRGKFSKDAVWGVNSRNIASDIAWVDIDRNGVENIVEKIEIEKNKKLYYTNVLPLYAIDSVFVDGRRLTNNEFCFNLKSGWVSLRNVPSAEFYVYYKYSFTNDLAVTNIDSLNFTFKNIKKPRVQFNSSSWIGNVPYSVRFVNESRFSRKSKWAFGDGTTSTIKSPTHVYELPGIYDVTLKTKLRNKAISHTNLNMIVVTADTIKSEKVVGSINEVVEVEVLLHNQFPVNEMIIPVSYSGEVELVYEFFSVDGCRTDNFEKVQLIQFDEFNKNLTILFSNPSGSTDSFLPSGEGVVLKLRFSIDENSTRGNSTLIDFQGYSHYKPTVSKIGRASCRERV